MYTPVNPSGYKFHGYVIMMTYGTTVLVETIYSTSLVQGLRKLKHVDRTWRKEPRLLLNLYTPVCIFSLLFNTEIQEKKVDIMFASFQTHRTNKTVHPDQTDPRGAV